MTYFKLPAGVRDILPEESARLDKIEEALRKKFAQKGFRTVRTAGLEYYDTFACIQSPVPQANMFKMTDKDGNLIVLRPDMTLACARIAATKLREDRARLCYFSNIYNFAAGGNSDREVAQAGVEIGMAQVAMAALPHLGSQINTVVLCVILVYAVIGPIVTKIALTKAGEIRPDVMKFKNNKTQTNT